LENRCNNSASPDPPNGKWLDYYSDRDASKRRRGVLVCGILSIVCAALWFPWLGLLFLSIWDDRHPPDTHQFVVCWFDELAMLPIAGAFALGLWSIVLGRVSLRSIPGVIGVLFALVVLVYVLFRGAP
jgi:hypothetical protein